jgi:hypothetical protein
MVVAVERIRQVRDLRAVRVRESSAGGTCRARHMTPVLCIWKPLLTHKEPLLGFWVTMV